MMQMWEVERMTNEHRRDLAELWRAGVGTGSDRTTKAVGNPVGEKQRSATGRLVAGGRPLRRPVGIQVGTWLIRAGTRLSDGSMRTS